MTWEGEVNNRCSPRPPTQLRPTGFPDTLTVPVSVKVVEAPRLLLVMLVAILAFACVLGWRRGRGGRPGIDGGQRWFCVANENARARAASCREGKDVERVVVSAWVVCVSW